MPNLWRLNVRATQIEECIRTSLFAVDRRPRNPELARGDYLLLQLVKADAERQGKGTERIEFALVFDRLVEDVDGSQSRVHWPRAGKTWRYILECSDTVPTVPFSLENLGLSRGYGGQSNPQLIEPGDAMRVWPWISSPQSVPSGRRLSEQLLMRIIRNWDRVVTEGPIRTTAVREHQRRLLNPLPADILKLIYRHHCQICLHDFEPRYGVPLAAIRPIEPVDRGGVPVSRNLVVLCPNHDAIIGATGAEFRREGLAFRYPNGLVEKITLDRHLAA
jgi:hypothetical protein